MNNNFMLQGLIENGNTPGVAEPKPKRNGKWGGNQLELLIGTVFNESYQVLEEHNIVLDLPPEPAKLTQKLSLLKEIIEQLAQRCQREGPSPQDSAIITCKDCQVYEANLQKLEGDVRQHIRYEQQLKIYQDTQEEKLEQAKKERKEFEKKIQNQRKQLEDMKTLQNNLNEKTSKLEGQIQSLRRENKELKRQGGTSRRESHRPNSYHDCKENKIDWVHRNVSRSKEEKGERRSVEKRGDSSGWRMSHHNKSQKMMSIMNDKLINERTNQERRKIIHSKLDYRR